MKVWELREALAGADPDAIVEAAVIAENGKWQPGIDVLSAETKMSRGVLGENYPAFVIELDLADVEIVGHDPTKAAP